MTLIYYHSEWLKYSKEFDLKLNEEETRKLCRKLIRHFKLKYIERITFNAVRKGHCIYFKKSAPWCRIDFPKNCSLGMICHELAHAWELMKYRKAGHNKKHTKLMERIINYCRKKNYGDLNSDLIDTKPAQFELKNIFKIFYPVFSIIISFSMTFVT